MNNEFLCETNYLKTTQERIQEVIQETKSFLEDAPRLYKDNILLLYSLQDSYNRKLKLLNINYLKPYFARIDFKDSEGLNKCYIGKVGVMDSNNDIITVDWRAPIASVYYDNKIGYSSYESPDGIIEGELLLKRQYEIENGVLSSYRDVDTVSNDEILKPYLSASADNRLKNIVASIQEEQNLIIRKHLNNNIIVQGVAGSGKTTVALHRIAYLVYNNMNLYKPEDYMVIGPSAFFVNYISGVLPDLDVNGVKELTYSALVQNLFDNKLKLKKEDEKAQYKLSMEYCKDLEKFLNEYILNYFIKEDFKIHDYIIITNKEINNIYKQTNICESLKSRLDKMLILLNKTINQRKTSILANINHQFFDNDLDKKEYEDTVKIVKGNLNNLIRKYLMFDKLNPLKVYKEYLKSNDITEFDLPGLLLTYIMILGNDKFDNLRHIVIDEAQDNGDAHFYSLRKLFKNATFSIFGDLAQSIRGDYTIKSWDSVVNNSFLDSEIMYLKKTYRTTCEIMNEANKVLKYINYPTSVPVIRHGDNVNFLKYETISDLIKVISSYQKSNFNSMAIITKNNEITAKLYEDLSRYELDSLYKITPDTIEYKNGICIVSSELSKGLEFDEVIIYNLEKYDMDNILDAKKLYVAMTRALHKLTLFYSKPSQALSCIFTLDNI